MPIVVAGRMLPLGELVEVQRSVIDPARLDPAEPVDLFSIPAYDELHAPQRTTAGAIKSIKQEVGIGSVLVSRINPHIPRVWYAGELSAARALASTEFICLQAGPLVLPQYLHVACSSPYFARELARHVSGTSSSHQRVKVRDCLDIPVQLPSLEEQRRIGDLVIQLEQKASIARAHAAAAMSLLTGQFAKEFPAVFRNGQPLSHHVTVASGVSYRSEELRQSNQALVTLKCFGRDGLFRETGLKGWQGEPRPDQIVSAADVVVAQTDLTQAGDVLGRALLVPPSERYERLAVSLDVAIVRAEAALTTPFVIALLRQPEFRRYCKAHANGTTVLHLPRAAIPSFPFAPPSARRIARFSETVSPLIERYLLTYRERVLAKDLRSRVIFDALPG